MILISIVQQQSIRDQIIPGRAFFNSPVAYSHQQRKIIVLAHQTQGRAFLIYTTVISWEGHCPTHQTPGRESLHHSIQFTVKPTTPSVLREGSVDSSLIVQ